MIVFIAKAKSLNMLEIVITTSAETNISIEYVSMTKEVRDSNENIVNKRISPKPSEKSKKIIKYLNREIGR